MGKLNLIPFPSPKEKGVYSFLLMMLIFSGGSIYGQTLTLKQFLKSSLDDAYYKSFDAQNSFLQNRKSYSLPWVDEVQFRYQDNQLNNYQSRYGVRINAGNPFQISRNNKYYQGIQVLKSLEQKMALKELMFDRYEMAVEFWMASEITELAFKQKELRNQIGNAYAKKAGSTDFDPDKFLDTQLDLISKEADWHEASFERDLALKKILDVSGAPDAGFRPEDLITVDQINQLIQSETKAAEQTEYELLKQRVEVSARKMKLEKSNFDLGYLQALYNSDRQLNETNSAGFAFGVTVPITNPNKDAVAREKLNVLERQGELEQFQFLEKNKKSNASIYLKLHLSHYQKLDSLITAVQQRKMNILTSLATNYDPIIELKYQEKLIQFEALKARIKKEILLQYIAYLDSSDKLHERPLTNYLSGNLERLED
jgi:hypothetical protein